VSVDRKAVVPTVHRKSARVGRFAHLARVCVAGSIVMFVLGALLGPSMAEPRLPGAGPLRAFAVAPDPWVSTIIMWLAIASGAVGLGCAWAAMVGGWRPPLNRVWGWGTASALVLALVPPLGSSDITNYAVYGRLATLGLNPYLGSADELARMNDPVGLGYSGLWHSTPSVYGPVATFWEYATSLVAGSSMRMFAILTQLAALVVFLASAWLLDRVVRDRPAERLRVAVLWTANPLLIFLLVNSAHVDVLAVFFGVAAITALRRSAVGAGVLAALATCTKVSFILYVVALAWALRRRTRDLKVFLLAVALTATVLVTPFLPEIYRPLLVAAKYVSHESPWHAALNPLNDLLPSDVVHQVLTVCVWVLVALVAWRMSAVLPKPQVMEHDPGPAAAWAATVLSLSWLLCSTYFFAWYDAMAWAPLVLIPASRLDLVLLIRTAVVAFASAPGMDFHPTGALGSIMTFVSNSAAPVVGAGLILIVIFGGRRLLLPGTAVRSETLQPT
jgi:hypothetical protein